MLQDWRAAHHEFSEKNEIHAEMNCIAQGFRHGVDVENASNQFGTVSGS